jgi:hypothetical protein
MNAAETANGGGEDFTAVVRRMEREVAAESFPLPAAQG